MALKEGKTSKTISYNISELLRSWKSKNKLGYSHPKNKSKAFRQAIAIAYSKAKKPKGKSAVAKLLKQL